MNRFKVRHITSYDYVETVLQNQNQLRMTPRNIQQQFVESHRIDVDPSPEVFSKREDFFGNQTVLFSIESEHRLLNVVAESIVSVPSTEVPLPPSESWELITRSVSKDTDSSAVDFRLPSSFVRFSDQYRAYALQSFTPNRPILEASQELMHRIYQDFTYDPTATTVHTTVEEVFALRRGVCQDFTHFALACLRAIGVASRYVSGYIESSIDGSGLVGSAASHAWFSVYCPGQGWFDFDPTNNCRPRGQHIVTSFGRDYSDVAPIRGIFYGGGKPISQVIVEVQRFVVN